MGDLINDGEVEPGEGMNHYYQQLVQHDMYGGGWEEKGMFERKRKEME